jgi:uncharacterized membrane protein YeaQ/YmgE (transglycosylase-associated protein family)
VSSDRGWPRARTLRLEPLEDRRLLSFTDIAAGLTGVYSPSLAWGDYDNDGDLDLALAGDSGSGYVSRIYRNDGGAFTNVAAGLTGVHNGSLAWGDYDNDGDLDLALAGNSYSGRTSRIYRNDAGAFTDIAAGLPGVASCSLAWGDYDNDGDLDLALAGLAGSACVSRIYRNDAGAFTDIAAGLPGLDDCSLAWGDYDDDGDLDLALAGLAQAGDSRRISRIYRNDAGAFADIGAGLTGVEQCSLAWGDYDNDGDLDLALAGYSDSGEVSQIYRNDGGAFTDIAAGLTGAGWGSSVAWGDYDNDGDLDLALAGRYGSRIYRNDGETFTDIDAGLTGVSDCSLAWGDYDNDGDLDLALAGDRGTDSISRIYRNDGATTNTVPLAPTGLSETLVAGGVTLRWSAGSDAETPTDGLSYNLRVGTTPGGSDIVSPMAGGTGWRRLPAIGNAREVLSWTLEGLALGAYYWSVQTIDGALAGSTFAAEENFVISIGVTAISGNTTEAGGTATFTVTLASQPTADVTIPLSSSDLTEGTVPASVTITPAQWDTGVVVAVTGVDDLIIDGDIAYSIVTGDPTSTDPNYDALGAGDVGDVCVANEDDESFTDIAAGLPGTAACSLAWGDYDNDGDLDVAIAGAVSGTCVSRIYRNDAGAFTDIAAGLTGVKVCSVAWGDYDNDGDLDLALAGRDHGGASVSRIYRNDGGAFTDIAAGLTDVDMCSLAWGDYDNDGDLDLALAGDSGGDEVSQIYRNDGGAFTDIAAGLTGVQECSLAWGDYDNDGDLDLALAGSGSVSRIYRNDAGAFSDIAAGLPRVFDGSLAWGDYDNDADLDLALAGYSDSGPVSRIYRNDAGAFSDVAAGLTGVTNCSLAWGDYDNDGDLDLAIAGVADGGCVSAIYLNDGGTFTDVSAGLTGVYWSSLACGDYDNDGDLDLALAGYSDSLRISRIYRNDGPPANTAPTAPGNLNALVVDDEATLSWDAASDSQTPAAGLSYNLRVGTTPGGSDILSGMVDTTSGWRRLPAIGNAQEKRTWSIDDLAPGTYYWSVQGIDTAFAGSAWATAGSFVVYPNVAPTANAGGPYSDDIGTVIVVTAAASTDPGNDIVSYAWDLDNDSQFDDAVGVTANYNATTKGCFTIRVQVTDDNGASGVATTTVTVDNDTVGLYDPATGRFHLRNHDDAGADDWAFIYGQPGWTPLAGDWNGDGIDTIGLFKPVATMFYLRNSNSAGANDARFGYGYLGPAWQPIAGDWNGDGIDTVGLYDPATSTFYLKNVNASGPTALSFSFGQAGIGLQALSGDWNGDGVDTIGVFNPATRMFYLRNSNSAGANDARFAYGYSGPAWRPVVGDWDSNGTVTVGLFDPATSMFFLKNTNANGPTALSFSYGQGGLGWQPIIGDWDDTGGSLLAAAGDCPDFRGARRENGTVPLTQADLGPVIAQAVADWASAGVAVELLDSLDFIIADLPGSQLGRATLDAIFLDIDAAGHGWFIDLTPADDEEFTSDAAGRLTAIDPAAVDQIDLLTVVSHEIGHTFGLDDLDSSLDSLMSGALEAGVRRGPA